jgi:TolB-like protein
MIGPAQNPPGAGVFRLNLLGNFALLDGAGQSVAIPTKKNRALLAILALSPGRRVTRERLASLLWGDRAEEQARASLRQSLAVLRKELGAAEAVILHARDDVVVLGGITVDVEEIERARKNGGIDELRRAAGLCAGELLADTTTRDEAFSDWLEAQRRTAVDRQIALFEILAERETGAAAVAAARRLMEFDPLRETSHRVLIAALAQAGEMALALQQFEKCREMLKSEFGVAPAPETMALVDNLVSAPRPSEAQPSMTDHLPRKVSLAVLPLVSLGSDTEQQYLADGLTEDLITDLTRVSALAVIAAHSVFNYRRSLQDIRTAGADLGVSHVVSGSVRRVGDSLRLNVQLTEAASATVLWADRLESAFAEVQHLQDELISRIVSALVELHPDSRIGERYRPASPEAFDLVMRGREIWRTSDKKGTHAAELFERAIALDPNYSEAYRWLAHGQAMKWVIFGEPEEPWRRLALENARRAVACDPGDSAAHAVLAFILQYERDWDGASAEYEHALRLNPYDGEAWSILSDLRVMEGRGEEALKCARRSFVRNPRPLGYFYWLLGQAEIAAGDPQAAVKTLRRPETYGTESDRLLAAALSLLGRDSEARFEACRFLAANPHFRIARWIETQPFRDLSMRDRFVAAYRKAGLPD